MPPPNFQPHGNSPLGSVFDLFLIPAQENKAPVDRTRFGVALVSLWEQRPIDYFSMEKIPYCSNVDRIMQLSYSDIDTIVVQLRLDDMSAWMIIFGDHASGLLRYRRTYAAASSPTSKS